MLLSEYLVVVEREDVDLRRIVAPGGPRGLDDRPKPRLDGPREAFVLGADVAVLPMRPFVLPPKVIRPGIDEMLANLRRREMIDAKKVINAQESVINFSSSQLDETRDILDASEKVAELSRTEAMDLHQDLVRQKEMNKMLSEEIEQLLQEIEILKNK